MLIGHETEYGIIGHGCDPGTAATQLLDMAMQFPCLQAYVGGGVFLANGSRFYVDCSHPEIATAEVDDPFDAVVYLLAGDEFLRQLAVLLSTTRTRCSLNKSNIDYRGLTTWAAHENYSHRCNPLELPRHLIPHLVSRIILSGAGGLAPCAPGIKFVISPRVCFLECDVSASSTSGRGIFHAKDEPLAIGWHRLHLLCGESLLSHRSNLLRTGTTALLVALLDAGFKPEFKTAFVGPALEALRSFNLDPTLEVAADLRDGGKVSALQLQWAYLRFAENHLSERLPNWAGQVCRLWRETLELLEGGVSEVSRHLDWAIKYLLYTHHARARGFSLEEIERWNLFLGKECVPAARGSPRLVERILQLERPFSPPFGEVRTLALGKTESMKQAGLDSEKLEAFFRLRDELCELDVRFSDLNSTGLFNQLDTQGLLCHRLEQIPDSRVLQATQLPPATGRAKLRGQLVRQLATEQERFACDWQGVFDLEGDRRVDLTNPLAEQAEWVPWDHAQSQAFQLDQTCLRLQRLYCEAEIAFNRGDYNQAAVLLGENDRQLVRMTASFQRQWMELRAFSEARRGQVASARRACTRLATMLGRDSLKLCATIVSTLRFCGLIPVPQIQFWLRKGEQILLRRTPQTVIDEYDLFTFRYHQGRTLTVQGHLERAKELLEPLVVNGRFSGCHPRTFSRARCDLADTLRRLGAVDRAREQLQQAKDLQEARGFEGDLADHSLTGLAKLGNEHEASTAIRAAVAIQERLNLRMGLVRSLCIEARRFPHCARHEASINRILTIAADTPALQSCRVFKRISRHWNEWLEGAPHPEIGDFYWGL